MNQPLPPISDAESPVMEVLWRKAPQSSEDIAELRKLLDAIDKKEH